MIKTFISNDLITGGEMKILFYLVCILILIISLIFGSDQNNTLDIIYLKDGSLLKGNITEEKTGSVILELSNSWKEINRSEIVKIRKAEKTTETKSRPIKLIAGLCINDIIGYDYQDVQGYGLGPGFRIGYSIEIIPRLILESTYTHSTHESDSTGNPNVNINVIDLSFIYIVFSKSKIHLYGCLGTGLDLFSSEGVEVGPFSYIPRFGIGSYIDLNENINLDLGFNAHIVRFDVGGNERPDASYLQFLILLNYKL
jgi:hypothetical protein